MKTPEEIKKGLEVCSLPSNTSINKCFLCPYKKTPSCSENMNADARSLIQQLEERVPKWISVEERLPETSGRYLVCISCPRGEWIESNRYDDSEHAWEADAPGYHECSTDYVTHWMPLPEPPKEG